MRFLFFLFYIPPPKIAHSISTYSVFFLIYTSYVDISLAKSIMFFFVKINLLSMAIKKCPWKDEFSAFFDTQNPVVFSSAIQEYCNFVQEIHRGFFTQQEYLSFWNRCFKLSPADIYGQHYWKQTTLSKLLESKGNHHALINIFWRKSPMAILSKNQEERNYSSGAVMRENSTRLRHQVMSCQLQKI